MIELVVAALLVASSYFYLYLLLGLGPSVLVERYLSWQERKQYLCVGSIVLALEMLATNFAELGDRYPEARDEAISAFSGFLPDERTRLLDTYLPDRDTSAMIWRAFYAQKSN